MRNSFFLGLGSVSIAVLASPVQSSPITTLPSLTSNGTEMFAVYVSSEAADRLSMSVVSPNPVSNMFCNYSFGGCTAAKSGQVMDLGVMQPGISFSLTDNSVANVYQTDALAADGYSHAKASITVNANDSAAVAAAYGTFGQGQMSADATASIAKLGEIVGTSITFVGWEDRIGGDFDYNDLIFAFTDPPVAGGFATAELLSEPASLAFLSAGLFGLVALRRRFAIPQTDVR